MKTHIEELKSTNEITKGCLTFLICDEILKESNNEFIVYLNQENFNALIDDAMVAEVLLV